MNRLWAKIYQAHAIRAQYTLESRSAFRWTDAAFSQMLQAICAQMDIETPIVLTKHLNELKQYHKTRFSPSDFIQPFGDDYLELEYIPEKKA